MYQELMPHWKKADQCFEDEQTEVIDSLHHKKNTEGRQTVSQGLAS